MNLHATICCLSLIALAPAANAVAAPQVSELVHVQRWALKLSPKVMLSCSASFDGYAARLVIKGASRRSKKQLIGSHQIGFYRVVVRLRADGALEAIAARPALRTRCDAQRHGRRVVVLLGALDRKMWLPALLSEVKKPPRVSDKRLRHHTARVESLINAGKFGEATDFITKLDVHPSLRDHLRLRAADVQLLLRRFPTAYRHYQTLAQRAGWDSGAGMLAALRAAQLQYAIEEHAPPAALVASVRVARGPEGEQARSRLAELLFDAGQDEAGFSLILHSSDRVSRALRQRLLWAYVRRATWRADYYGAAVALSKAGHLLEQHPVRAGLLLAGARAHLELGLPADAVLLLQQVLRATKLADEREQAIRMLVSAYREAGERFRAVRAAEYYLSVFGRDAHAQSVADMRARLLLQANSPRQAALELRALSAHTRAKVKRALARAARGPTTGDLAARLSRVLKRQAVLARAYGITTPRSQDGAVQ